MLLYSQARNLEQGDMWAAMLAGPREGGHNNVVVFFQGRTHPLMDLNLERTMTKNVFPSWR